MYYESNNYLQHFGVKGMKWGVRRYQKSDGSLTNAGKKRYYDDGNNKITKNQNGSTKPKSKHRQRLEKQYMSLGMTSKQAAEAADRRIRSEKIIAAVAGVAVAACAAYYINDRVRTQTDRIIKAGGKLQRIESNDDGKLHEVFYASFGRHDNARYQGFYGKQLSNYGVNPKKMVLKANANIKVAGKKNAMKVFEDLVKTDKDFRVKVGVSEYMEPENINKKDIEYLYDVFNAKIPYGQQKNNPLYDDVSSVNKKFFDAMKKKGYDAIQDVNDKKFSGYNARTPLILFNNNDNKVSVENITNLKGINNKYHKEVAKNIVESNANMLAAIGATGAGFGTASKAKINSSDYKSLITNYKKQHPNTTMSDIEIKNMYAKKFEKYKNKRKK